MKVFTFVSLLLMPPTLIASIYGMNINLPVAGRGLADFFILLALMIDCCDFCSNFGLPKTKNALEYE